jgi:hypothetical protein
MRNEASPESVRTVICPVIHPLSIRPVVHADGHPGSSEVSGCTPSLCCSLTLQLSAHQEWEGNKPGMK